MKKCHLWQPLKLHPSCPHLIGKSELSRREVTEPDGAGVQMMVHGISAPIHSQSSTEIQQRLNPSEKPSDTTKTSRPGAHGKISKVRNYNVKDWHIHKTICQYTSHLLLRLWHNFYKIFYGSGGAVSWLMSSGLIQPQTVCIIIQSHGIWTGGSNENMVILNVFLLKLNYSSLKIIRVAWVHTKVKTPISEMHSKLRNATKYTILNYILE